MKNNIDRWIEEAKKKFLLQPWEIGRDWTGDDENSPMGVRCKLEYLEATIVVNLKLCKTFSNNRVRFFCYHEVVHILLWEFADLAKDRCVTLKQLSDAEEKLVQIIARVITK